MLHLSPSASPLPLFLCCARGGCRLRHGWVQRRGHLNLNCLWWPLAGRRFAAVVVVNYLHRPLFQYLVAAVAPGGMLLYDTFAMGNEAFGRPSNPDFLLRPGELTACVAGALEVVDYFHGRVETPKPAIKQQICARRK